MDSEKSNHEPQRTRADGGIGTGADLKTIRQLATTDAPALQALRASALVESPNAFAASPAEDFSRSLAETEARLVLDANRAIFGLFDETVLAAIAGIAREGMAKLAHKAGVWGVYVSPTHRGTGAGKALLIEALEFATNLSGVKQVNLYVNATNANAVALYESLGFVTFGVEHNGLLIDGIAYDELLMVWLLRASTMATDDEARDGEAPRRIRTLPGLTLAQTALAELMSEISEDHYCAGWLGDLEYSLWSIVTGASANMFGFGPIEWWKIKRLKALSAATGGWIELQRPAEHETFVPLDAWLPRFAAHQAAQSHTDS